MSSDVARRTRTRRQDGARGDEPAHRLDGASAECGDGPAGLANGVPVGIAATHLLASQLYGVPTDVPWTLIAMTVVLTVIATLAALRPARTALRIDPMALLRAD